MRKPDNNVKTPFAIITRTLGRSLLLERTIQSVEAQTYDNFEMIIINDGGDADEIEKLVEQTQIESKIKVIHNSSTLGRWPSANKAILHSHSKYVVLLDDDDTWEPNFLDKTLELLQTSKWEAVAVSSDKILEDVTDGEVKEIQREPYFNYNVPLQAYDMYEQNILPTNAFVYSRKCFDDLGGYDESMPVLADWEFNIRFISKYNIYVTPEVLAHIHHRQKSTNKMHENTVISGTDVHNTTRVQLLNRALRDDLERGVLGRGILLNQQDANRKKFSILDAQLRAQCQDLRDRIEKNEEMIEKLNALLHEQKRMLSRTFTNRAYQKLRRITKK